MTAGAPPKPREQELLLAKGDGRTPGSRRVKPDATPGTSLAKRKPGGGIDRKTLPPTPTGLKKRGKAEWFKVFETGAGWLRPHEDYRWVEILARAYDEIDDFWVEINIHGLMVSSPYDKTVLISNPLLDQVAKRQQLIMKCLQELGFSPRARASLGLAQIKTMSGLQDLQNRTNGSAR